ncbi:hypothetical protein Biyabedamokiny1_00080 [Staphylococcus phage Biyabeda-mokiny_1]|nr:hypothetical protein Biyabedamokiny1_00080 [Staphylococcus phage Biyabeda-mokiny_1]
MYVLDRTVKGYPGEVVYTFPYYFNNQKEVVHFLKSMGFTKKDTNCWVRKTNDVTFIVRARKMLHVKEHIQKLKEWENDL